MDTTTTKILTVSDVVSDIVTRLPDVIIVSTCGFISREVFNTVDRTGNLYLLGSMGMAAPIALGIALSKPHQTVMAIDGDGSLLMNLSTLPMVASVKAPLLHVVADNGMHESTGGQRSVQHSDFATLALSAGYPCAARIHTKEQLRAIDLTVLPLLVHVMTAPHIGAKLSQFGPAECSSHVWDFFTEWNSTCVNYA